MDFKKDYYEILEISRGATKEEIKASYRRLAKKYHPDVNPNDDSCAEKFKLINDAYQVISNDILRREYDEFHAKEDAKREPDNNQPISSANKRTYQRKKTSLKETRFYVRGKAIIDFWGDESLDSSWLHAYERRFKLHPTNASVEIAEEHIFRMQSIPLEYLRAYKESDLFATPLRQPIKCIVRFSEGDHYYELNLEDIRIKGVKLEGITKYEGQSLGVLKGDLYAFSSKFDTVEEVEEVTEFFGPTGNFETESDEDAVRVRKEFYNSDGSTFWGPWQETRKAKRKAEPALAAATGCSSWLLIPFLLIAAISFPRLLIVVGFILAIALFFLLIQGLKSLTKGGAGILGMLLIGAIVLAAVLGSGGKKSTGISHIPRSRDSVSRVKPDTTNFVEIPPDSLGSKNDSLVRHYIQWEDYDGALRNVTMTIRNSDLLLSKIEHDGSQTPNYYADFGSIYKNIISSDYKRMGLIFSSFESLRRRDTLDQIGFAKAIVSCIQSLQYYLVLNKSCSDYYMDQYVQDYLKNCIGDCCIGNETYGVRTPLEFVGDLKGDCDTRALFLYTVLGHFGYDVALLTSDHYRHALIAVSIPESVIPIGVSMTLLGKEFFLWETTSKGFNIGQIPDHISNLQNWNVALINTK